MQNLYQSIKKPSSAKACPGFEVVEWLEEGALLHDDPAEQPQGLLSAIASLLLSIFGGKK